MAQLGEHEDWTDNVLLEWTAALELHQRGRVKAVLPLLVGKTDFFTDAQEAFGGVQALPTGSSASTMAQVTTHLEQTTGDASLEGLHELLRQATGDSQPGIQAVVACILKFQGIKLSEDGAATAHSHGHLSVGTGDLTMCTNRVRETVATCLRRVGSERIREEDEPAVGSQIRTGRFARRGRPSTPRSDKGAEEDVTVWDTPK
jgi:hypothetical protein